MAKHFKVVDAEQYLTDKPHEVIILHGCEIQVFPGDWIVTDEDKKYVVREGDFAKLFHPAAVASESKGFEPPKDSEQPSPDALINNVLNSGNGQIED